MPTITDKDLALAALEEAFQEDIKNRFIQCVSIATGNKNVPDAIARFEAGLQTCKEMRQGALAAVGRVFA